MSADLHDSSGAPSRPLANWHLRVAYDGTAYRGWQVQPRIPTVQGRLEKALNQLFPTPPQSCTGTSRTDAGAHALDQHVSFRAAASPTLPPERVAAILNARLPVDIRVLLSERRDDGFHARHSAHAKAYVYTLRRLRPCPPFEGRYVWNYPYGLDLDAMRAAAEALRGRRDFASFGVNPKRELDSTVRTVHRLDLIDNPPYLHLVIIGDSFLYKMVRSLVGFLVETGMRSPPDPARHSREVLAALDRSLAGETAPACGLFLAKVFYAADAWQAYQPPLPPQRPPW